MYVAICEDESEHIRQIENCILKLSKELKNIRWKTFNSAEDFLEIYNNDSHEIIAFKEKKVLSNGYNVGR